ncbi:alpha/beta fold hydrolase [Liquorilactobacillus mali]|uniref:alpha/beta fold hydrolase n=1 Tax=Liquorilactobacillus mali TaxID=1618 RepID=UPI0023509E90|nr:alpha/beta hydrolase [Liquorilactobacillus mali]MDC7952654.1 alpha/beta hydrolase [Liquorilactobacillus mali]
MQQLVDDILIHYEIIGTGEPIVFIHGLCLDLNSMKFQYEPAFIGKKYQRIYIDLPGMGESQSFFAPQPSSDYLMELIIKFLDSIKINTFYLCGHSYGGYLSLGIAYNHSNRVKGLFLTCPVVTANSNKRIVEAHSNIRINDFKIPSSKYTEDFIGMNVVIDKISWQKYTEEIIPGLENCDFNFIERLQSDNFDHYQFQNEMELKNWSTDIPVFLLLGKHDHIVGFKEQAKLVKKFEKCNLLILENAGHNLPVDQSEIFDSCIKYFFV